MHCNMLQHRCRTYQMTLFSIKLGLLPTGGMITIGADYSGLAHVADVARHMVLPVVTLSLFHTAFYARLMRASMLEVFRLDFVTTARAKGVSENRVVYAHVLRNALLPVVTVLGLLGTVIGMIEIFGSQAPGSGTNPTQLAHGISVALYNTAFGLMVAIPSLMAHRYFRSRVNDFLHDMEQASERLLQQLLRQASR